MGDMFRDITDLEDFYNTSNPFYDYIMAIRTEMPGGENIIGVLSQRRKALLESGELGDLADMLVHAPGDRTLNFGDKDVPAKVGLGVPIAYDIWYVFAAGNILKFGGKDIEETMEKMEGFFEEVDDAKPLIPPISEAQPDVFVYPMSGRTAPSSLISGMVSGLVTIGSRDHEYAIKEARFETLLKGDSPVCDSKRTRAADSDYSGYIAFPVGPLGVMWRISLATESSLSSGLSGRVYPVDATRKTVQGGELLPPFDLQTTETCGEMMMNKGYLVDDDSLVEIFAEGPGEKVPYHYWLRYWIKKDNTEIVPGEFAGLLCRPWPLHCWWHQETAPFVYSGHWIETEFYTSGIVKEVEEEPAGGWDNDGEVGNRYTVWVKNEEIVVKSTDFLEYEVDERVGLLKTYREGEVDYGGQIGPSGQTPNFCWQDLELLDTKGTLTEEWVIVPADFYGTGSGVGGA